MAESYLEKRKRILAQQKKRAKQRELAKKTTIGPEKDIVRTRAKKKPINKLAALPLSGKSKRMQKSKSSLNPSVDYSKTPKAPKGTIKRTSLGARNIPTGKAPTTKNITKSAMGAKTFRDYKTIAAAKKAGSLYYMGKDGKKKAAVTASDLKKSGLSLRDFLNFKLGKMRKGK